jgi:membrane fusion protein, multidrug efflux system
MRGLTVLVVSVINDNITMLNIRRRKTISPWSSPIAGVTGLRMIDPGNIVHASDATGTVIINQLRPIAVLFSIAEDRLPRVLANMRDGASLATEAWSRDLKVKYATCRLTAVDNQIDTETGTVKLKAVFDRTVRCTRISS